MPEGPEEEEEDEEEGDEEESVFPGTPPKEEPFPSRKMFSGSVVRLHCVL